MYLNECILEREIIVCSTINITMILPLLIVSTQQPSEVTVKGKGFISVVVRRQQSIAQFMIYTWTFKSKNLMLMKLVIFRGIVLIF